MYSIVLASIVLLIENNKWIRKIDKLVWIIIQGNLILIKLNIKRHSNKGRKNS
jgi:hypothetical protein